MGKKWCKRGNKKKFGFAFIYIYIYIYRERERERERKQTLQTWQLIKQPLCS